MLSNSFYGFVQAMDVILIGPKLLGYRIGGDAKVAASPDVAEDMTVLLVPEADVSPFESLIPKYSEPIGVPSFHFFLDVSQQIMSNRCQILWLQQRFSAWFC